jgi:hypothetical protein
MQNIRTINPSDLRMLYFCTKDVLQNEADKEIRNRKLERAMVLSNCEHITISLSLRLYSGETVETQSDVVDFGDDYITLKGGYFVPVRAIVDVDA